MLLPTVTTNISNLGSFNLDSSNDKVACRFVAEGSTIAKVVWSFHNDVGSPSRTLKCRIEGDSNGSPDGVDVGSTETTFSPPVVLATGTITFASTYAPSAGTKFWVVIWDPTTDASNYYRTIYPASPLLSAPAVDGTKHQYGGGFSTDGGTSWSRSPQGFAHLLDGSDNVIPSFMSHTVNANSRQGTVSTGDEVGTRITIPTGLAATIHGISAFVKSADDGGQDGYVYVGTTEKAKITDLWDPVRTTSNVACSYLFDTPVDVGAGDVINTTLHANSASWTAGCERFASSAGRAATTLYSNITGISRSGRSGAFTEETDRIYGVVPIIEWKAAAGGGGGGGLLSHPGMAGGANG